MMVKALLLALLALAPAAIADPAMTEDGARAYCAQVGLFSMGVQTARQETSAPSKKDISDNVYMHLATVRYSYPAMDFADMTSAIDTVYGLDRALPPEKVFTTTEATCRRTVADATHIRFSQP